MADLTDLLKELNTRLSSIEDTLEIILSYVIDDEDEDAEETETD